MEQAVERRAGSGSNGIDDMGRDGLDPRVVDDDGCTGEARRLAQKGAFARVGLDKLNLGHAGDRQHETGEAGAAAEIDEALRRGRNVREELDRIEEMAAPEIAERVDADEVYPRRPADEEPGVGFKPD